MQLVYSPQQLQKAVQQKPAENIFFRKFLRNLSAEKTDKIIHRLNKKITPEIDCTQCGNCCKKLEPALNETELTMLAQQKKCEPEDFRREHVSFDGSTLFLKSKPCVFLHENKCMVYGKRPMACADYPHLTQKNMKYKQSFWDNYSVCPIVYNVIEQLKAELNFKAYV